MSKIGIISGGGKLPIVIGKNLINSGNSVIFFCIETEVNKNDYDNFDKFFPADKANILYSSFSLIISMAWVPIEPVEPIITIFFIIKRISKMKLQS